MTEEEIEKALDEIIAALDKMGSTAKLNEYQSTPETTGNPVYWKGYYRGHRMAYLAAVRVVKEFFGGKHE